MNLGHTETEKKKTSKAFRVVAVAQGDGMAALFEQMGADRIVWGGQGANPSTEDFVEAFRQCDGANIIVLPNNKNIVLAAQQAAQIYTNAKVHVLQTKNIAQGYSALSVITPGIKDVAAVVASAERAAKAVIDGEITCAVRDVVLDGKAISAGDYIAISGGSIAAVAENPETAVLEMLAAADTDLCEIITLFVGKGVCNERRVALTETLKETYEDCEIVVYQGGQEVYDYLVAVE